MTITGPAATAGCASAPGGTEEAEHGCSPAGGVAGLVLSRVRPRGTRETAPPAERHPVPPLPEAARPDRAHGPRRDRRQADRLAAGGLPRRRGAAHRG